MIWLTMLIPIFTIAVLLLFFHAKVVWWEHLIILLSPIVIIFACQEIGAKSVTQDVEYWGSYAVEARHYEHWNEKVSCRHPKYVTKASGKDSRGNTIYEEVQVGYKHFYDVDEHPEYWKVYDNINNSYIISKSKFIIYTTKWKNKKLVDMNRDFYNVDGNMHSTRFTGEEEVLDPIVSMHAYENRVQASDSIMNFPDVERPEDYGLYEYPKGYLYLPSILGDCPDKDKANRILDIANAKMGSTKQVRIWFLIFNGQSMDSAIQQQNYWKGGNKNELIVCIGLDKEKRVSWCYPFSWTTSDILIANVKYEAMGMGKFDAVKLSNYAIEQVNKHWVRREFEEFSRLKIKMPPHMVIASLVLTLIANILTAWYVVANEITDDNIKRRRRR